MDIKSVAIFKSKSDAPVAGNPNTQNALALALHFMELITAVVHVRFHLLDATELFGLESP